MIGVSFSNSLLSTVETYDDVTGDTLRQFPFCQRKAVFFAMFAKIYMEKEHFPNKKNSQK